MSIITPHTYQKDYSLAIEEGWKSGFTKQVIISPTGSGKGNMLSWQIEKFHKQGLRSLVLVDQGDLAFQAIRRLRELTNIHAEAEKAEWRAAKDVMCVASTVQSMARRLDQWPKDHFGLIINDEADRSLAAQWMSVLKHFDGNAKVIGFTATPWRSDQRNLGEYYENLIEKENLVSLIKKGFLSPVVVKELPVRLDLSGVSSKGGDFDENELDELITPYLEELISQLQIHAWDRCTLGFLPLIKTCEKANEIARDLGLNSDFTSGSDPDRDSKLQRYKSGEIDVMFNAMLLTRGVDVPRVDAVAMWRPTRSITLYFQTIGRATRLFPGKRNCLILDPLLQAMKRLVCRPAHLIAKTEEEAEAITELLEKGGLTGEVASQLDLLKIAGEASSQREAALKKKLEEHKDKQAKTISAEEFALRYHSIETAEFEPTMQWEAKPIEPKQIKYLNEAGINLESVKGYGHARKLLEIYFKNKPVKMASMSQRLIMKRMRHPNWERATEQDAKQFFAGLHAKNKQHREPSFI